MGLVNRQYWVDRFGSASPCWSGDRWVDFEHGVVARHAVCRLWPKGVQRVIDIGCGDGRFSEWMALRFGVGVLGTDALTYPGVEGRIIFLELDAEEMSETTALHAWDAQMAVFMNSLTCMADWRAAVVQATQVCERVLVFDNFTTPTPPWLKGLPHRVPIEQPELEAAFSEAGFVVERKLAGDWLHRKLFLRTPRWSHPAVAVASASFDVLLAHVLPASRARHVAYLFGRGA